MSNAEFIIEPGRQDIVMTRVFDAPRDVVFKAVTDPELIPKWWGPRDLQTIVEVMEPRPGGRWRFVHAESSGEAYAFKGVYHDVVAPERIVRTMEFEGVPGHVLLETTTLEDIDGKTRYQSASVFQSIEDRDGMVQSGMESGARDSLERLEELLKTL